jgi:hypothetical protein
LNSKCLELGAQLPKDFQRKTRDLKDLKRWKATELRTFLLYICPVVLKDILPSALYRHFLHLHFSVTVLLHRHNHTLWLSQARACLQLYVKDYKVLYGKDCMIYNVHCLLHLCDFVSRLGHLHQFSAFPFEKALHGKKQRICSSAKPLEQIANRMCELDDVPQKLGSKHAIFRVGDVFR